MRRPAARLALLVALAVLAAAPPATSAAGDVRVEIQDASGKPLPGFTLDDCPPIFGDAIERTVTWKTGGDVGAFAGKSVRLRFALKDADLFAIRFQ